MIPQEEGEAPGLIDEALSHEDLSDTEEEDHHHDDIVEHLDVIGKYGSLPHLGQVKQWGARCSSFCCFKLDERRQLPPDVISYIFIRAINSNVPL